MGLPPPGRVGAGVPRVIDDQDTEETILDVDDADVQEVKAEVTGAVRACGECGREVFSMSTSPPPRLEDIVAKDLYWDPKSEDGEGQRCSVSGPVDAPVWWFCPWTTFFVVRGVVRARVERLKSDRIS